MASNREPYMTTFLACTNSESTSEKIADYLSERVAGDDVVLALNSLRGGDDTSTEKVRAGQKAVESLLSHLPEEARGEDHQFVRGNDPDDDILDFADEADVDELVIGVRKRNPTGKVVFGSTAQRVLLNSTRPVVAVPLAD